MNTQQPISQQELGRLNFEKIGLPTKADEAWKHSRVELLDDASDHEISKASLEANQDVTLDVLKAIIKKNEINFVFVDGVFSKELSDVIDVDGLSCTLLSQQKLGVKEFDYGNSGVAWQNLASSQEGIAINVKASKTPGDSYQKINLFYFSQGRNKRTYLHNSISLGQGTRLTVREHSLGGAINSYQDVLTDIDLGKQANLRHEKIQQQTPHSVSVSTTYVTQAPQSQYDSLVFSRGTKFSRNEINVKTSDKTMTTLNGLFMSDMQNQADQFTNVLMAGNGGNLMQDYRGLLKNQGHGIFNGIISVAPNARQNLIDQSNQNLLLDREVRINTRPQLLLKNDDVQAKHGATTRALDPQALFYLTSRGLEESAAKDLLKKAFVQTLLDKFNNSRLTNLIKEAL